MNREKELMIAAFQGADVGLSKSKRLAVKESEEFSVAVSDWSEQREAELQEKAVTMMRAHFGRLRESKE